MLAKAFIGFLPKQTGKYMTPISPTMQTFIEQITFQSCAYWTNKKRLLVLSQLRNHRSMEAHQLLSGQ